MKSKPGLIKQSSENPYQMNQPLPTLSTQNSIGMQPSFNTGMPGGAALNMGVGLGGIQTPYTPGQT